jgi:lysophospholipase L1-like esterase
MNREGPDRAQGAVSGGVLRPATEEIAERRVAPPTFLRWFFGLGLLGLALALYPHDVYGKLAGGRVISAPMRRYLVGVSACALATALYVLLVERLPGKRIKYIVAVTLVTALVLELVSACALRLITGRFHLRPDFGAFTYHPALVGLPTPGYARHDGRMHVSHNTAGFRGRELDSWWWGAAYRIAAVGGSTTYDIALSDDDTWVAQLGARLGSGAATLNMGVPGHSTAEHIILVSLLASDFRPTVVIYYVGWNDIANSHVATLKTDYSNPHFLSQFGGLQVDWGQFSHSAFLTVVKRMAATLGLIESPYARRRLAGTISSEVDDRLLDIYDRNVRLLVSATRTICAEPVLVPQVLNRLALQSDGVDGWLPYLPKSAVWPVMSVFNQRLVQISKETGAVAVDDVLKHTWDASDFVDSGHFSRRGASKFAAILAHAIRPRLPELSMRAASRTCDWHHAAMP